jgi:hypothetical protein
VEGEFIMTQPWRYQIQVEGRLSERWMLWFEDMEVSTQVGNGSEITTLTGAVVDQAALLGLLQKLYTLGLSLLLVQREENQDA